MRHKRCEYQVLHGLCVCCVGMVAACLTLRAALPGYMGAARRNFLERSLPEVEGGGAQSQQAPHDPPASVSPHHYLSDLYAKIGVSTLPIQMQ